MTTATATATATEPTAFAGESVAVGTWLYRHIPASTPDCGVIVSIESVGAKVYDIFSGMRQLPRCRVMVAWDGGTAAPRLVEHISDESLRGYNEFNGLTGYYGFLAARFPSDSARAAFVTHCADAPARRAASVRAASDEADRLRREVGPWFADIEDAMAHPDRIVGRAFVPDTLEAKVIRKALRDLAGVHARVTVRRYSMASGLSLSPAKGRNEWTQEEAARIAQVFPGMAWEGSHGWRVDLGIHPRERDDRSDLQADYHAPGGFRVANEHLLAVSQMLSDAISNMSAR